MAAPNWSHPALAALLAHQQGSEVGQPNGRPAAMPPDERNALKDQTRYFKGAGMREAFSAAPDGSEASDRLCSFIEDMVQTIVAVHYYLKEFEPLALVWVGQQFTASASHHWKTVLKEARRTATTTGIGPNSVLYRALRDMLLAYPPHGIKTTLLRRKKLELYWDPKKSAAANRVRIGQFFEAWDRGVDLTSTLPPGTQVPAQTWTARLSELQEIFPAWIQKLVTDSPGRFNTPASAWALICETDAARTSTQKSIQQLADLDMRLAGLGEPEMDDDGLRNQACWRCDDGVPESSGFLHALRNQACWRCGARDHLRKDCPYTESTAEREGKPLSQWAYMASSSAVASSTSTRPAASPTSTRPAAGSSVAALGALQARMDRQDTLLETILSHIAAPTPTLQLPPPSPPTVPPRTAAPIVALSSALSNQQSDAMGQPTCLAAITGTESRVVAPSPPMIMGGPQPAGYVLTGTNQGLPLWVEASIVDASVMHQPGNDESSTA